MVNGVKTLPMFYEALQRYDEPYNDSLNRYNDSLEHIVRE
jgi:hypothetical protein